MFGIDTLLSGATPYLLGTIFVISLAAGIYFKYSQNEIATLNKNLVSYEITIKSQQDALVQMGADAKLIKQINIELSTVQSDAAQQASVLADKLQDLETMAKAKPDLVEQKINAASAMRNRCFELATGAPPVPKETNTVCPQLLKAN